jgi:hypothetical protein
VLNAALKANPLSSGRMPGGACRGAVEPVTVLRPRGEPITQRRRTFEEVGGPKGGTSERKAVSRETSRRRVWQDAEVQPRS